MLKFLFGKRSGSKSEIQSNGTISWFNKAGDLHRENGPAIEFADGRKAWYLNGHKVSRRTIEE